MRTRTITASLGRPEIQASRFRACEDELVSGSGRRVAELVEGFQVKVERLASVPERFREGCGVGDYVGSGCA
jgi:hypothetical protein